MITLDPIDIKIFDRVGEAGQCDLFRLCRSPATPLIVLENPSNQISRKQIVHRIYPEYLKSRETVFLNIGDFQLVPKAEAWDTIMAEQLFGTTGKATKLIHLNDAAATAKYSKLWEHCCQDEKPPLAGHERLDFGAWLEMCTEERNQNDAHGWMKRYTAWKVADHAFEEHLVTPQAFYLLQLADYIMDDPEAPQPGPARGHEIMDYTGKLKEGHPKIQQLDFKLPEVIPVCTVRVLRRCRCVEG
ncbi:hypothetical protein UCDDA912_g07564 [Diaporthe ampelina]|uniref:Uncharacterized protein n=1 Tax=Diaporthe ampelina TaxID=1214573 RepID=A0A0G2FD08_9PEZI|nr:hypothetical protein UCDDA912_g07564 [Diaporthe ampelina]